MKSKINIWGKVLIGAVVLASLATTALAQSTATAGGTAIKNKASASYTDDPLVPTKYNTTSNEVITTVAYVAGLSITPDQTAPASGAPTPMAGSTATFTFDVNNLSNFSNNVSFLASGGSILVGGPGTVSSAFIDVNGDGIFNGTDVDINDATADLYLLTQSGAGSTIKVVVKVLVDTTATAGTSITVSLGDTTTGGTTFDNQPLSASAKDVKTSAPSGITITGTEKEAKGSVVQNVSITPMIQNGPNGAPAATGPGAAPANTNTDYTNKAVDPAAPTTPTVFDNTMKNTGNGADTFTIKPAVGAGSFPTGSTVEISIDGGSTYTTVVSAGALSGTPSVTTASVAAGASLNYKVRVTLPTGVVLNAGYDTVITVCSVTDPLVTNNTIDRLFPGYLVLNKTAVVSNGTGVGGATDPVPGADINYTITATNVSAAPSGTGSVDLPAQLVSITDDGDLGANNWASTTNYVAGEAANNDGTAVTPTVGASTGAVAQGKYTAAIGTLNGGKVGTLTFSRKIKP
jgi:hypothetical protein